MPTQKKNVINKKVLVKEGRPTMLAATEDGRSAPQFTSLRESEKSTPDDLARTPTDDLQRLMDKVKMLTIALEDKERNVRNMQIELADWLERYTDLYEFAPVGYVTLDRAGKILETNL